MAVSFSSLFIAVVLWNADEGVVAKRNQKAIEIPGTIGPTGEMLVMDVDPVSEEVVYRVEVGRLVSLKRKWWRRGRKEVFRGSQKDV